MGTARQGWPQPKPQPHTAGPSLPCAAAGGRAAASASPHRGQSTRRQCGPPKTAPGCPETWQHSWPPARPGAQLWSLAPTLGGEGPRQPGQLAAPQARQHPPSTVPTNEVPPGLVVLLLAPAAGPAHQHRVVLQPPQPAGLDEVGHAIPQVRGDHHLTKALHLLRFHQAPDGLQWRGKSEIPGPRGWAWITGTAAARPSSGPAQVR